ncbi:MAG: glycosyltransferase family 4 protein, partial [Planctomycetota bacterium]
LASLLVSTSPPGCALAAVFLGAVRRVPTTYWVMDLVPDHLIVTGALSERSLPARIFHFVNRFVLKRVTHVVTLDRYMSQRLNRKFDVTQKLEIMPPWPHDDHVEPIAHADNPFRKEHGLDGKFVIMYSGNHSPYLPLDTVVQAALRLQDEEDLLFMFIGGGLGKKDLLETIEREKPRNMVALPYQPFDRIKYSLSAADVHLVSVGDPIVGVGHSCKIYGAMAVARPILALAPARSHLADLVDPNHIGWRVEHGDVDGAVATIRKILATDRKKLEAIGLKARQLVCDDYSKALLLGKFADVVESGLNGTGRRSGTPSP